MKGIIIAVAALLILTSTIIYQRANVLIYSMTSTELPELLDARYEGEGVVWFDDYYTIYKILAVLAHDTRQTKNSTGHQKSRQSIEAFTQR